MAVDLQQLRCHKRTPKMPTPSQCLKSSFYHAKSSRFKFIIEEGDGHRDIIISDEGGDIIISDEGGDIIIIEEGDGDIIIIEEGDRDIIITEEGDEDIKE